MFEKVMDADIFRMFGFLVMSVISFWISSTIASYGVDYYPEYQTLFRKVGLFHLGCFCGYWSDRRSVRDRITSESNSIDKFRRSFVTVFTGFVLAVAL